MEGTVTLENGYGPSKPREVSHAGPQVMVPIT